MYVTLLFLITPIFCGSFLLPTKYNIIIYQKKISYHPHASEWYKDDEVCALLDIWLQSKDFDATQDDKDIIQRTKARALLPYSHSTINTPLDSDTSQPSWWKAFPKAIVEKLLLAPEN